MGLIESFVQNPVKVAVGVLLVVLFGSIAVTRMPVELTPQVERPTLSVRTRWPGAGPEEVEREIVYQQEEQLKAVPGMITMTSRSSDSRGEVSMEFDVGTDLSEALVKVNTQLQQVSEYPEDAQEPVIRTADERSQRIAMFSMVARPPSREQVEAFLESRPELRRELAPVLQSGNPTLLLERFQEIARTDAEAQSLLPPEIDIGKARTLAEQMVATRLGRVAGVADVWVWSGEEMEMQVVVDPELLAARELTIGDVRRALRGENQDTSGGDFQEGKRRYTVRTMGRFRSPQHVENVILTMSADAPVYVRDVAEVHLGYKKPQNVSHHFDSPCLRLGVVKETGANIMEVMAGIRRARDELNDGLLKQRGLFLHQAFDTTIYIESALGLVQKNIFVGGALTLVVLLLFLRSLRSTMLVAVAIPVSVVGTLLMLYLLGRTLNVISLAGMAFAVGMLVDNAVVVLENIYRHFQMGKAPVAAALRGTKEVWGATLASTLTTLAVFVPILFVQEEAGQLFRDIALAISCGVGLSLLVSITVIPTAAARILAPRGGARRRWDEPTGGRVVEATQESPSLVTNTSSNGNGSATSRSSLHRVSRSRKNRRRAWSAWAWPMDAISRRFSRGVVGLNAWLQRSVLLRLVVVGGFVSISVVLSYLLLPPVEYLPKGNRNRVMGRLNPPPGYSVTEGIQLGKHFHDALRPYVGDRPDKQESRDWPIPQVDDFVYGTYGRSAWFGVRAVDSARAGEFVDYLKEIAAELPGIDATINQSSLFEESWSRSGRQIDVDISGPDLKKLVALGKHIRDEVRRLIPGTQAYPRPSLDLATPELHVVPKKEQAASMGMTSTELGYTVNALVDGAYASDYFYEGEQIDLTIMGKGDFVNRTQDLGTVSIAVPTGHVIPLAALADIELRSGPDEINHIERERGITIQVVPPVDVALGEAMTKIERELIAPLRESGRIESPYQVNLSGTADKLRATWTALRFNLAIALLITYLLMAGLFESWLYPLVIMVSVPLAIVGGLAGLRLMNLFVLQQLDVLTMLGFIILIGTVVNNAILIVHQSLNHMRDEGLEPRSAILASVDSRIRPIFMTTFTTTFGLLPLVFFPGAGSELYRGLGSVVLGGLLVSTIFTLVLVPTLFSLVMDGSEALRRMLLRHKVDDTREATDEPVEPIVV